MELIKGIPSWNFEVLVNVFDDDPYWDTSLQEDLPEAYEAISSIGKKYASIPEYEKAMETYEKYEPQIIDYYGGQKAVDFIIDEFDSIPVGIINPPKLKNKLKAKYVQGINYGIGEYYDPVTPEQQVEWDRERFDEEGNPAGEEIPLLTRSFKRALRSMTVKKNMQASSIFFNTDIISQIRSGTVTHENEESSDRLSLSLEEHEKLYEKRHAPHYDVLTADEISALAKGENESVHRYALTGSMPMSTDIFIKKMMIKQGLNPITPEQKKSMSRTELQRLASYLGPEYVYDDKTMKKIIKQTNKAKKDRDREFNRYKKTYDKHNASTARALANLLTVRSRIAKTMRDDDN